MTNNETPEDRTFRRLAREPFAEVQDRLGSIPSARLMVESREDWCRRTVRTIMDCGWTVREFQEKIEQLQKDEGNPPPVWDKGLIQVERLFKAMQVKDEQ